MQITGLLKIVQETPSMMFILLLNPNSKSVQNGIWCMLIMDFYANGFKIRGLRDGVNDSSGNDISSPTLQNNQRNTV